MHRGLYLPENHFLNSKVVSVHPLSGGDRVIPWEPRVSESIYSYSSGQNGHHLVDSPGGQWSAPVVGLGIVELVEQFDGVLDSV